MADDNIRKTRKSSSQATTGDAAITPAKSPSKVQATTVKEKKEKTDSNEFQKIGDKIIAKMVNEGQLVRNTGTNSLKSIGDKLVKFDAIFKSINIEMQVQTSVLKNIHNELMNEHDRLISVEKRRIEQSRTKESEEEEDRRNPDKKPKRGDKEGKKEKNSSVQGVAGLVDKILSGPIGMLMTIPIRAIGAVMGGITGNIVSDYILETAENLGIQEQYLDAIAAPLKGGLIWGGIGMAISKKMGVLGLVAGAAWPLADQLLDVAGFDPKQTLMGLEIGDIFAAIMSGSFMYLLKKNFNPMSIMRMVGEVGGSGKSALPRSTIAKIAGIISRSKFALVAAINLGFEAVEGPIISYLENNTGIDAEDSQSVINWTQMGMSIGAMFGPYGLIAGAAIGLAIGLGSVIYNWLTDTERTTKKRIEKSIALIDMVNNNPNKVLNTVEIKNIEDNIEYFKNNNRPDLVQELNTVLQNQEKQTGKDIISRAGRESLDQTMEQNYDHLQGQLLEISKLPVADQSKAYDDLVGELHKQNPELPINYISDVLKEEFGNSRWYNGGRLVNSERADISDMYDNIASNSNVIQSVNYTDNGKHVSTLFDEVVMPAFQKAFASKDKDGNVLSEAVFDPKNIEIQKWIEENPEIRSALNQIYAAELAERGESQYKSYNGAVESHDIVAYKYLNSGTVIDTSATEAATEDVIDFVKKNKISQVAVGPQTVIIQGGDTTNINSNTVAGSNNNTQSHNFNLRGGNGRIYGMGGISRPN